MKSKLSIFRLFSIALLGFFSSCEDVVQIDLDKGQSQLVVDAMINNKADTQNIYLSQSIDYFDNSGKLFPVSADTVYITDNQGKAFVFSPNGPGRYIYVPNPSDSFTIGNLYTLHVTAQNHSYVAQSKMERVTSIDSIGQQKNEGGGFGGGSTEPIGSFVYLYAKDLPGQLDIAWIRTYRDGKFLNAVNKLNLVYNAADGPGSSTDGLEFIFPISFIRTNDFESPYLSGEKVKIELYSISEGYYYFLRTAAEQSQNGGLFATPPVNVKTNIEPIGNAPKALGYFNVGASSELEITID